MIPQLAVKRIPAILLVMSAAFASAESLAESLAERLEALSKGAASKAQN
jgi:hypothetical protein